MCAILYCRSPERLFLLLLFSCLILFSICYVLTDSIGFLEVYVTCDMESLQERNSRRRQPIPADTIHRMASIFEKPNSDKFDWESNNIEFNSKDDDSCEKM